MLSDYEQEMVWERWLSAEIRAKRARRPGRRRHLQPLLPQGNRSGISTTFENALIGTGVSAVSAIIQEFLLKKLTPTAHNKP